MSPIRISCARFAAQPGDSSANLDAIAALAARSAANGSDLLVLPEFAIVGDAGTEAIVATAETIPGPSSERLAAIAREHGVALAVGLIERDPVTIQLYNTMLFLDADGHEILRYRKVHLWINERKWATAGSEFPVAVWGDVSIGLWVCYDTRFPEAARKLALNGARLALVGTAWVGPPDEWELALRSRAMDNGIFVVGSANHTDRFCGEALIIDPHGQVLAQSVSGGDDLIYADIDMGVSERFHESVPLLPHRRPETY